MDQNTEQPSSQTVTGVNAPETKDSGAPTASSTLATPSTPPAASPAADLSKAPLPTAGTLRRRASLPIQAARFVVFNARIMRMVRKGHH